MCMFYFLHIGRIREKSKTFRPRTKISLAQLKYHQIVNLLSKNGKEVSFGVLDNSNIAKLSS